MSHMREYHLVWGRLWMARGLKEEVVQLSLSSLPTLATTKWMKFGSKPVASKGQVLLARKKPKRGLRGELREICLELEWLCLWADGCLNWRDCLCSRDKDSKGEGGEGKVALRVPYQWSESWPD